jgi:branched-chain amino acid transport system substrate-binding protein
MSSQILTRRLLVIVIALLGMGVQPGARAAETIKIAYMDPLSGPFASGGQQTAAQAQYALEWINAKGGALGRKFELLTYDDKLQPSEGLNILRQVTDQNIRFVMSCQGSNVAAALIDGVNKYNERNPDNRLIYLNCASLADEFTNDKCTFWHFRFDANAGMKSAMQVRAVDPAVKKVYLINEDYLFGQSMHDATKRYLAELRPDVQIVGDEMIPLGKVQDFSPYVSKIQASGAQALLTGNYGPDFSLLVKAGSTAGLDIRYYANYANAAGIPTQFGPAGIDKVVNVQSAHQNVAAEIGDADLDKWVADYRAKHEDDLQQAFWFRNLFAFVQAAMTKAGSDDPLKVALALEGMSLKDATGEDMTMRKDDHQVLLAYRAALFTKGVKYETEKLGLGWKTIVTVPAKDLAPTTSCKMKRPSA